MKTLIAIPLASQHALFCASQLLCDETLPCNDGYQTVLDADDTVDGVLDADKVIVTAGLFPGPPTFPGTATFPGAGTDLTADSIT